MKVWMLDPGAMNPYYDIALANALRNADVELRLITSRYLYETAVPLADQLADHFFFRAMEFDLQLFRRLPWLRRAFRLLLYPLDWLRLRKEIFRTPPDLIHIQWLWLPVLDRWFLKGISSRIPLILTVHDTEPRDAQMTHVADMLPLIDLAQALIVHTEENRQTLIRRASIDPRKIAVIPLGPLHPNQIPAQRADARRALNINPEDELVLFFGVIKPSKGLLDLIAAMPVLLARRPKARLMICGRPEGSLTPYIQAAAKINAGERIIFHASYVASTEVPLYFSASDVVCLPYRQASQSGVLPTAYQFGCPVVVTRVGGLPESVEEGKNGYIVPPHDPQALAHALANLLADPDSRERFGKRSMELADGVMSWHHASELTLLLYNKIITLHGKTTSQ